MLRALIPVVAATAALALVAGCAEDDALDCDDSPELAQVRGEALPVEVEPSEKFPGLPPEEVTAAVPALEGFPSVTEQVLTELRRETLTMAGVMGEVGPGRCEGDAVAESVGSTTRCTVTYEGLEARWLVEITGAVPGTGFSGVDLQYTVRLESGVLTADMVYEQLAWNQQGGGLFELLPARCEELPDLFTVEPGRDSGHRCQELDYSCSDGIEDYQWRDMPVSVDEEGFVDFLVDG